MKTYRWTRPTATELASLLDASTQATVIAHPDVTDVVELAFDDDRRLRLEPRRGRFTYLLGTPVVQESAA